MGSTRQADTLVMLRNRLRILNLDGVMPPDEEQRYRANILAADLPVIRAEFELVNSALGFDRRTSRATPEQLAVLRRMEARAGVPEKARTSPWSGLTFEQAHKRIEGLKEARS